MLFYNFNNYTKLVVYFNTEHKLYSLKNPYKGLCVASKIAEESAMKKYVPNIEFLVGIVLGDNG